MSGGLRERKKQQTREAIVTAALRLFDERGYEATTLADIAAAADIAPRTFFGYFRSKDDVLFGDFEPLAESLTARLRERQAGEDAMDALRAWLGMLVETLDFDDEQELLRRRVLQSNPALTARERELMGRFEAIFAGAVAADLGEPAEGLRPRLVAAAVVAALMSLDAFYENCSAAEDPMPHIDQAMAFVRGGIAALRD